MSGFKISELDHIVLNVSDIERSLQFYTGVMGLPLFETVELLESFGLSVP